MLTDKLFTGQREITGLGIYYYGARFYSPRLGRFLSADTIVPGYSNPQNFNHFSYVNNNPLRYTDPTGHRACSDGEVVDCDGHRQDPSQNPHPPKHPRPPKDNKDIIERTKDDNAILSTPTVPSSNGTQTSSSTHNSSEETCRRCAAGLLTGTLALFEGLEAFLIGGAAAVLVITGAPFLAAVIPAAIFVGVALVGLNWAIVGVEKIYESSHPGYEVDYLPLVPDSWQNRGNNP